MPSKIILKKSSVAAKAPVAADLEFGELALNYTDSKLYFKKADGTTIDAFSSSAVSGTVTSVGVTPGTGISVSGSPITTSGNITVTNTAPNVTTDISITTNASNVVVNSSDGTDGTINAATTSLAGVMSAADKTKLDGIAAGAQVNVATNLAQGTRTTTAVPVTSSTGTTATLDAATTSLAGVMSAADKTKLDGISAGATANTGTVTSVATSGTVSGLTLTGGTITTSGTITLGGTLAVTPSNFASQTANTVLAAPNGAAGVPTFRALVAADIPTLNQNTTGTAANVTGTVAVANGGTGATTAAAALTNLGAYAATNPSGYTSNTGTVTSVSGTGTVSGLTLTGTVTTSGNLTLGGTLSLTSGQVTTALGFTPYNSTNPSGYITSSFGGFMLRGTSPQANPNTNFVSSAYRFDPNANNPTNEHYAIITYGNEGNVTGQLATHFVSGQTFTRAYNSSWSAWRTQLDSSNYTSYAMPSGSSATNSVDVRAPIFYDSQNTAYFTDPAGRSRQSQIDFGDGGYYIHGGSWGMRNTTPYGYIEFGPANSSHAHIYTDRSNFYFNQQIQVNGGSIINTSDIRAGIFYDSNNTGYYIDPNGTSYMNALQSNRYSVGNANPYDAISDSPWYGLGQSNAAGPYGPGMVQIGGYYGIRHRTAHGVFDIGAPGWGTSWIYSDYNLAVAGQARATIYYDYSDTAYYLDPNDTSRLNYLRPNRISLVGNQDNGSPRWDFKAYVVESPHHYAQTSTQSMYIGEDNYIYMRTHTEASGSHRAPIFYDSNNTGYYADLNSTTYLYYLQSATTVRADSDRRLKENITPITSALSLVRQLQGCRYTRNDLADKTKVYIGMIAQDVLPIVPEVVSGSEAGKYSLGYAELVPVLNEAVKELDEIVSKQAAIIAKLEERLSKLLDE